MASRKYRLRGERVTTEQLPMAIAWEQCRINLCGRMGWPELVNDAEECLQIYKSRLRAEQ